MCLFRRKSQKTERNQPVELSGAPDRSFPTDDYFFPVDQEERDEYEIYARSLFQEARSRGTIARSKIATLADIRVSQGPTQADRDNIPYIQEAWEWARRACASLGMKQGDLRYGVMLDVLTRMRATALIRERNMVWPEVAARTAGLDQARILTEHNAKDRDVSPKLQKLGAALDADCRGEDWDGVVWGNLDIHDPARKLKVADWCDGCGKCAEAYPDLFAMRPNGKAEATDPKAIRDPEREHRCLDAASVCPVKAIAIEARWQGTTESFTNERGRPLPGQTKNARRGLDTHE